MIQQALREVIGRVTYFVVLVRCRMAWFRPLYWRMQYSRLSKRTRELRDWDATQYDKMVNDFRARLAKEETNRQCAVNVYEALLADREKQIAELATNLRNAHCEIEELRHTVDGTLPVHPTEEQAVVALTRGEITFDDYLSLDFN